MADAHEIPVMPDGPTNGAGMSAALAALDRALQHAIIATDGDGRIRSWNAGAQAILGWTAEEAVGQHIGLVFPLPERDAGVPQERMREAQRLGCAPEARWLVGREGRFFAIGELVAAGGADVGDAATRFIWIFRDGTEARRAEQDLRRQRSALEILNRTAQQVAAELDLEKVVQQVVDAGVSLTGAAFGAFFYNRVDGNGESYMLYTISGAPREAFSKFPMPRNTALFASTFSGQGIVRSDDIKADPRYGLSDVHHGMPQGHLPVTSYLAVPVVSRSGEVIGGLFFGHPERGVFTQSTEQLASGLAAQAAIAIDNARLFEAEQRLNQTLEAQVEERTAERDRLWSLSEDLMMTADDAGRLLRVSPSWTRVLGHREDALLQRLYTELVHPDEQARVTEQLDVMRAVGRAVAFENRIRAADESWRWIAWTMVPDPLGDRFHGVGRDVTEPRAKAQALEEAQQRLRQSQKMETVGQLTGGIAHDFNNLLQVVTGNLELLSRLLPPGTPRLRRAVDGAMTGARRAATLTQRLLVFARRQPLAPQAVELNRLIASMSDLLHRTLGETVQIETVASPGLWRVEADPNELENAILNLCVNARDAMPEGGRLTIETMNAHLDRAYVAQHLEVPVGQYVVVSVSDTGTGMDAQTLQRAFEPFFTTKEVGKGTGLGLSMVYGFVKQSGGHVKIYSEPGLGTTVKIYLPRLLGVVDGEEQDQPEEAPGGTHEETVLVCEDDDEVRAYSVEVLRELGYRVLEAHDGASALRLLERQEGGVDLLFTDVVLPGGMNGAAVAQQARELRPGLKVLFTTGYARNAIVHHGRLDPGVELITKPFTFAELAARVRELLDATT